MMLIREGKKCVDRGKGGKNADGRGDEVKGKICLREEKGKGEDGKSGRRGGVGGGGGGH